MRGSSESSRKSVDDWVSGDSGDETAAGPDKSKTGLPPKAAPRGSSTTTVIAPAAVAPTGFHHHTLSAAPLQRQSSDRRMERLTVRRQQSLSGGDFNQLFRAHEAGLVVTERGSARRSLMKMGLSMERGVVPLPVPRGRRRWWQRRRCIRMWMQRWRSRRVWVQVR